MSNLKAQELVRELITETDHLSREWHEADHHARSARLEALRSTLQRIERTLGGSDALRFTTTGELDVVYQRLQDMASGMAGEPGREALNRLVAHADHLRHQSPTLLGPSLRHSSPASRSGAARRIAFAAGGALSLLIPLAVPALRRSPFAWGIATTFALVAVGAAIPRRSRDALALAGRDAAPSIRMPSEAFA